MRPCTLARPAALVLLSVAGARAGCAQVLGLPVVQSPFPGRPVAVAVDGGTGGDGVRVAGLALAARRPGGRLVATLGAGRAQGFEASRTSYGARLAFVLRFGESGALAAAPFAGYGRVAAGDSGRIARSTGPRLAGSLAIVPAGVGLGYRRLIAGRAAAVHVTPHAQLWRRGEAAGLPAASTWYGRVGVGADVAVTSQIGLGLAYEGGGSTADVAAGPRSGVFGVALSYAPGRRPPR
jgi:hypothetical protein